MRKILAAVLALAMLLALVPAVMAESAEPITVTMFVGAPFDQPLDDNKIYKKIEEEFGIKFEFEFLAGNLDEKLNLMMSDEDTLPDFFDGGNSAEKLEDAGVLIDLLPYITEEGTPNLYKHIYTDDRIKQLVHEDGALYIIPNYGIVYNDDIRNYNNGPSFFIQKQVIAWNNYKVPTTLDEYFDLIEAFIAANPTNKDGTPYKGFSILTDDWRRFCMINPVQHLMGRPNDGEVVIDVNDPDYHTETFIDKPYAKRYYQKLNEEYLKGIIAGDSLTQKYEQYIADLATGTVLGMFDQTWDFGDATNSLVDSKMYENTYLAIPLLYTAEELEGIEMPTPTWKLEEHYLNGTVMNKDRGAGISVNCKYPERLVKFMDAMLSDEWQKIIQWGIEGEDYTVDENGRMLMTREQYEQRSNNNWVRANRAYQLYDSFPSKAGTMDDGNAWDPGNQPEIYFDQMNEYDKAFLEACGKKTFAEFFNTPIKLAPYGEAWQIDKAPISMDYDHGFIPTQDNMLPGVIIAPAGEFDAKWDEFVKTIKPYCDVYAEFMHNEVLKLVDLVSGK
ncbi:MAG: extracellular solute-binding protein [Clostridiales bacterium]|nr:extracellular solute-binding protein [Clostridiales bacterium]